MREDFLSNDERRKKEIRKHLSECSPNRGQRCADGLHQRKESSAPLMPAASPKSLNPTAGSSLFTAPPRKRAGQRAMRGIEGGLTWRSNSPAKPRARAGKSTMPRNHRANRIRGGAFPFHREKNLPVPASGLRSGDGLKS